MTLAHYMILERRASGNLFRLIGSLAIGFCGLVCISVRVYECACVWGEEQTNERTKATQSHCMSPPTPHSRHLSEQDHKE